MIIFGIAGSLLLLSLLSLSNLQVIATESDKSNSIGICCAWNSKLADGELSFKISGGDETARNAVRDAIKEWEIVQDLTLTEISGKEKIDINVQFKKGGGMIAGQALRKFDGNSFIDSVQIQISGSAFGTPSNVATVKQITRHEMGHALGIGHANFDGDLMSTTVQSGSENVSICDINGVKAANHLKFEDNSSPHHPHTDHVHCT